MADFRTSICPVLAFWPAAFLDNSAAHQADFLLSALPSAWITFCIVSISSITLANGAVAATTAACPSRAECAFSCAARRRRATTAACLGAAPICTKLAPLIWPKVAKAASLFSTAVALAMAVASWERSSLRSSKALVFCTRIFSASAFKALSESRSAFAFASCDLRVSSSSSVLTNSACVISNILDSSACSDCSCCSKMPWLCFCDSSAPRSSLRSFS
mmetsp:Transcript_9593/g.16584  ORF Transcript_9593/g.16584 Transcript_9593/m.16584 type:complete len:218 (-) Transcript_9593:682-1335(-)